MSHPPNKRRYSMLKLNVDTKKKDVEKWKMSLEQAAKEIASEANECCYRSDGYEKEIEALALQKLKDAYNKAIEDIAKYLELDKWHSLPEIIRSLKK